MKGHENNPSISDGFVILILWYKAEAIISSQFKIWYISFKTRKTTIW